MNHVRSKKVLVTGAGTGIGKGVGLEFAKNGADVVFHYSHSASGAQTAAEEAVKLGVKAKAVKADFTDIHSLQGLVEDSVEFLGGIDVLVNNAGITMNMPFFDVTEKQFDTLFSVNFKAMFFLTQQVVPGMAARGSGTVVNISSVHAFSGLREHSVYAATKGAINSFTRQIGVELAPMGIRVNAIAAGSIEVENHQKVIPGYTPGGSAKRIPAGFKGSPVDIGGLAVYLAGEGGRFIIGQTIVVDGGFISYMPIGEDFTSKFNWSFGQGYVER